MSNLISNRLATFQPNPVLAPRPSVAGRGKRIARNIGIAALAALVISALVWQALTSKGNPDPTADNISPAAVVMDTGILVFREGLEAVIVLAALTASLARTEQGYWKPVALGAGASFMASWATWFIVVAIISSINATALHIQAATDCWPSSCC